jgi:hypothetical protein
MVDQTTSDGIFFELTEWKPSIVLLMLLHSEVTKIDSFVDTVTTKPTPVDDRTKPGILFAFSYLSSFAGLGKGHSAFAFQWRVISLLGSLLLSELQKLTPISLTGKSTSQIVSLTDPPKISLTSDADRHFPLLASSILKGPYFPASVTSVLSLTFSLKKAPKGEFVFFKVFLVDDLGI